MIWLESRELPMCCALPAAPEVSVWPGIPPRNSSYLSTSPLETRVRTLNRSFSDMKYHFAEHYNSIYVADSTHMQFVG